MYNYTKFDESTAEFIEVAPLSGLPNGERLFVEIDDMPIVIFNLAGDLYAIADICSHDDGPVGEGDLEGFEIICPRHGAKFDVRSGKVLTMPAVVDIPAYPVRVVDEMIQLGLPKD
jgi:3-phenylpropionate/trans-cinnamate dioxygenase ferredoxin subunit